MDKAIQSQHLATLIQKVCQDLTPNTQSAYERECRLFLSWLQNNDKVFSYLSVKAYKSEMIERRGSSAINQALAAIRYFARECAKAEAITTDRAERIAAITSIKARGQRLGNWLTKSELEKLLRAPDGDGINNSLLASRDRAILAILGGAGLRRSEVINLTVEQIQRRDERWVIVDIEGKGGVVRSVPIASWVKLLVAQWLAAAGIERGKIFRQCSWAKSDKRLTRGRLFVSDASITAETVRNCVLRYATGILGKKISPHDLRRSFARLAKKNGCPLDQIQLSLGHSSIRTTQIYIGEELDMQASASDYLHLDVTA